MTTRINFTTPAGRLVSGDLYKANTTDAEGKPLVVKSGPQTGQPRLDYYFAIAIPKGSEQHWSQTPWGAEILKVGATDFPQAYQAPTFAWKVKDGDSTIPNRRGKRPVDQEGYAKCWVLGFSSGYPAKCVAENGNVQLTEPGAIKLGYWVQVAGSVAGNGSMQQPGVFLNHNFVNLLARDTEIVVGPDATSVGFGQGVVLPPGVSMAPVAVGFNPAMPAAPALALPAMPQATQFSPPAMPAMPPMLTAVAPNPGFLMPQVPQAPALPVARARVMLPAAGGHAYETLIGGGWTDQTLIANGLMAP